ncbi:Lrp/AsnC family transcriptional regulator [Motiliproteus coralliicola]|uniref:Lrp/AsnC family transcriptional regulator n=1 Tax=Motiliproteus coralliicola TaxID=2283196 RepID=UPI001A9FEE6A|nr:Lrp/AsnC family transcriptional regulator [Motiliproteus coralliicola]
MSGSSNTNRAADAAALSAEADLSSLDAIDRQLINDYQSGFPLCADPYAEIGARLGIEAEEVLSRIETLLDSGFLSRFGPLFDIEAMGGEFTLTAMEVPLERYDEVTEIVNSFDEVAHNYEREHQLNMWFVLACESREHTEEVLEQLHKASGIKPYPFPKLQEFFIGLRFDV